MLGLLLRNIFRLLISVRFVWSAANGMNYSCLFFGVLQPRTLEQRTMLFTVSANHDFLSSSGSVTNASILSEVALTRFRRTLKYARLAVRMLTHTLRLPPALSEIYGGPRPDWLRDLLDYLPCLQSLIVSKLPFFDHNAMTTLAVPTTYGQLLDPYNVRLLLADSEPNTTSLGLTQALLRLEWLVYLDLSSTRSAKDNGVLSCLSQLHHLQVLKLRNIGLKDTHAEYLANSIGTKVRFLDLRENQLTDMAVRSLLQGCFKSPGSATFEDELYYTDAWSSIGDLSPYKDPVHALVRREDLDELFIKTLTQPPTGRSWLENLPHVGITHLYVADNQITVEGVASLLASKRLHVLDVGTVNTVRSLSQQNQGLSTPDYGGLPGAEKLIPVLGAAAKDNMTYLRAHHAILTAETPTRDPFSPNVFLPELPGIEPDRPSHSVCELEAIERDIHELPSETSFAFELADTSIPRPPEPSSVIRNENPQQQPLPTENVRRGSIYAPEVIVPGGDGSDAPIPVDEPPHFQKIDELLKKRPKKHSIPRKDGKEFNYVPYLHPSHVPHLETIVLTDVPSHVPVDSPILAALRRFLTACSNEALLATLKAGTDYSLPPGQSRAQSAQSLSRSLFALRRLVLEIVPASEARDASGRSWKITKNTTATFKSSTGDSDLENMWSVATNDFSFFETECGLPEYDYGKYFPMAVLNEKVTLMPEDDDSSSSGTPSRNHSHSGSTRTNTSSMSSRKPRPKVQAPTVDLVAELAAFRRAKKMEYEERVRNDRRRRSMSHTRTNSVGSPGLSPDTPSPQTSHSHQPSSLLSPSSPCSTTGPGRPRSQSVSLPHVALAHYVEGHWKGEVKIVRNPIPKGRSGMVDMFGNYFEKGYLYP